MIEELARIVALLRLNLEEGDRRMAVENCNVLINYCEKGKTPNDLCELRALHDEIQSRIESGRPLVGDLVCEMGASIAPTRPTLPANAVEVVARAMRDEPAQAVIGDIQSAAIGIVTALENAMKGVK